MIKQIIVVRKDLKMKPGKLAAQVAHASMKIFFDRMHKFQVNHESVKTSYTMWPTEQMDEWMQSIFTKICLRADSEEQLDEIATEAEEAGLPVSRIIDSGQTVFNNVPTFTCIAIGPDDAEKIDEITGHLKLL